MDQSKIMATEAVNRFGSVPKGLARRELSKLVLRSVVLGGAAKSTATDQIKRGFRSRRNSSDINKITLSRAIGANLLSAALLMCCHGFSEAHARDRVEIFVDAIQLDRGDVPLATTQVTRSADESFANRVDESVPFGSFVTPQLKPVSKIDTDQRPEKGTTAECGDPVQEEVHALDAMMIFVFLAALILSASLSLNASLIIGLRSPKVRTAPNGD